MSQYNILLVDRLEALGQIHYVGFAGLQKGELRKDLLGRGVEIALIVSRGLPSAFRARAENVPDLFLQES